MSATFQEIVTLEKQDCGSCGGVFAVNKRFLDHARESKGGYTCPYCKIYWSWSESEADKLRKQLEEKSAELWKARIAANNAENERDAALRKQKEADRKVKRSEKGVCTCCNRSFTNLRRHMQTKHAA